MVEREMTGEAVLASGRIACSEEIGDNLGDTSMGG